MTTNHESDPREAGSLVGEAKGQKYYYALFNMTKALFCGGLFLLSQF